MIPQINGGEPKTHARNKAEFESPGPALPIEKKQEAGYSEMQAWKYVHPIAAGGNDCCVPSVAIWAKRWIIDWYSSDETLIPTLSIPKVCEYHRVDQRERILE
jgi:hypothetical protein